MKPNRRSKARNCLFCYKPCSEATPPCLLKQEVLGAVHCLPLQRQLEHLFILRHLLDIPAAWCEDSLARNDGELYPDGWFRICSECVELVRESWRVYQKLLELETRLQIIKGKIRTEIEESVNSREVKDVGGFDNEIRKLVCPDLTFFGEDEDEEETLEVKVEPGSVVDPDFHILPDDPCLVTDEDFCLDSLELSKSNEEFCGDDNDDDDDDDFRPGAYYVPRRTKSGHWGQVPKTVKLEDGRVVEIPRKRGRPPSTFTLEDGTEVKIPRKRGRPFSSRSITFDFDKHIKRRKKRGRPPKTTAGSSKRGRKPKYNVSQSEGKVYRTRDGQLRTAKFNWKYCTICRSRFKEADELAGHLEDHEESKRNGGIYDCKECLFPARSEDELKVHAISKHKGAKEFAKMYSCGKCEFSAPAVLSLKQHIEKEHPDLPEEEVSTDLQLKCNVCSKTFLTRNALVVHEKRLHPERFGVQLETLSCDKCDCLFTNKIHLQFHMNNAHMRVARYVCDTCGKGYKYLDKLEKHKVSHRKGLREFVCHICGIDYAYKSVLEDHHRKYHPNGGAQDENPNSKTDGGEQNTTEPTFKCKYCDLTSQFRLVVIRHMQTHKAEMGHQCDICQKYYTNAQGLKRHKRINHPDNVEEVHCPHCFKTFSNIDYMKSHVTYYCRLKSMSENKSQQEVSITSNANIDNSFDVGGVNVNIVNVDMSQAQ